MYFCATVPTFTPAFLLFVTRTIYFYFIGISFKVMHVGRNVNGDIGHVQNLVTAVSLVPYRGCFINESCTHS